MAKKSYPSREERMKDLNQRLEQGIRDVFESERFRDYLADEKIKKFFSCVQGHA